MPDTLEDDNSHAAQRGEHMIINFPIGSRPRKKYRCQYSWSYWRYGQKAFADADVTLSEPITQRRRSSARTGTHICFTRMDGDRLVIHASTQVIWHLRRQVALVGMKQHKVHVIKERVGGGFGSKQDILLEEVCAWATWV
ncbi:molybdopterin-dependent oxidoreductase [Escherichia coli]|nr:molybdopterin-dependent oxidoreductase [Escherichia coli]